MVQATRIIGTGLATTGLIITILGVLTGHVDTILGLSFVVFILVVLAISYYYAAYLQLLLNRVLLSLEWCLNSPPKPHAFSSSPIYSVTWLNFFYNGHWVTTCIETIVGNVVYYSYYTASGVLVFITTTPYIPS